MTEIALDGDVILWAIGGLSVVTLALILLKLWRLSRAGAWASGSRLRAAIDTWQSGDTSGAVAALSPRRSIRAQSALAAMRARLDPALSNENARAETVRIARSALAELRSGLRALDLIVTIAPLLGLLGTVLGMIEAFQALQEAGARADPAALAGGIWAALLTTAAGMAVAIPASAALTWFDAVADRVQAEMEDDATRIFTRPASPTLRQTAS